VTGVDMYVTTRSCSVLESPSGVRASVLPISAAPAALFSFGDAERFRYARGSRSWFLREPAQLPRSRFPAIADAALANRALSAAPAAILGDGLPLERLPPWISTVSVAPRSFEDSGTSGAWLGGVRRPGLMQVCACSA